MSLQQSPVRARRTLTRLSERPWKRAGLSRTVFYEKYVNSGRVKLIAVGVRARAVDDDDIDRIIEEMVAAPTPRSKVPLLDDQQLERRRQAQADARAKRQGQPVNKKKRSKRAAVLGR